MENQERAQKEDNAFLNEAAPTNNTAGTSNWDPILISLVRRAMPNLIAYDIAGVQPMTGPTGLIFAMRSRYTSATGNEALFDEADTECSASILLIQLQVKLQVVTVEVTNTIKR